MRPIGPFRVGVLCAVLIGAGTGPVRAACETGCADGEREGFVDRLSHPDIAGCSGAWTIPGVHTENPGTAPACPGLATWDTTVPACGRAAGDDGANPSGAGCSVADLCEAGWHVCVNEAEILARSPGGCAGVTLPGDPPLFFAARLTSNGCGACATGARTDPDCDSHSCTAGCLQTAITANDFWGCGNFGGSTACGALDRFSGNLCANLTGSPWSCNDPSVADDIGYCEAYTALKAGVSHGGVLCCRDAVGGGDQPPTVDCPPRVTAAPTTPGSAWVDLRATAADDCGNPSVANDRTRGGADASDWYPCGRSAVTFLATDSSGQTARCTTEVEVADPARPGEASGAGSLQPLRVRRDRGGRAWLEITYDLAGTATARINLYRGSLSPWGIVAYDHGPIACRAPAAPRAPGAGWLEAPLEPGRSCYYLVSLSNCAGEGSRGAASSGAERPDLPTDCGPLP